MDIQHTVSIKATPARIFEALTTPQGISAWWTAAPRAEAKAGGVIECLFDSAMTVKFRVERFVNNRRVVWAAVSPTTTGRTYDSRTAALSAAATWSD